MAYWHISVRPSGAYQRLAGDMANYVRFYLNRGSVDGAALLTAGHPSSAWSVRKAPWRRAPGRAGLRIEQLHRCRRARVVWQGHNGAIDGGLGGNGLSAQRGRGSPTMINATNGAADGRLHSLVKAFLTRN